MKSNIWQDKNNWTHIDWELDGVTSKMLNWFWSNMEKCDNLWHPGQHIVLTGSAADPLGRQRGTTKRKDLRYGHRAARVGGDEGYRSGTLA